MPAIPSPTAAVSVRALERRFAAVPVLRRIDLDVQRGECVALFGPNGAGKSTLLRTLAGLLRADAGTVELFGVRLPADAALRRRIGYLGHDAFLYRDLDALENLAYYGRLFGVRDAGRAAGLLAEVGLERFASRRVSTFSRGMLQRLGLARALLHEPELLLLDEPLTGLDPQGAELLSTILARLRSSGVTVLMATHDIARALESATRSVVLDRGRVGWDSGADAEPNASLVTVRYTETVAMRYVEASPAR
ncbi:MAG: heme ABC exporter ATP-binding protein CcmA [Candidatus Binatia bacterium]